MELSDYQHLGEIHSDELLGKREKVERLKPEYGDRTVQGKWTPLAIYVLLGFSILLSVVILGTAIILLSQMLSEMKMSDADFKIELSHLKSNVTGLSEKTSRSLDELRNDISQLTEKLGTAGLIRSFLDDFKDTFPREGKATWKQAQKMCKLMNADLVVVNSAEEQMYLDFNTEYDHWIGLHDTVEEGEWLWVDGTDYNSTMKFWGINQPNTKELYGEEEDCVVTSRNAEWHDWPCKSLHYSICEKSA
ncbi:hepatic lectin-like isoform X2 [Stegostoma tigrinum]|uniref:hepatic lectin-like isoform X2 n=1 Tax=Stegostoma tigrinum TaxID=3053191 RepID=UPI00202B3875|nr:hepatic lectin-like isoform X2 [Stegostoma tigrinum]